ncbi:uncharacterized protein F58A4.6 isoform X2 [Lycorma delicatula]|uniref:uncharacterized protein F58A4.6 isoform X2 n=1 Tax=Lycorma delicatula TaxID=130591 RepID=UPI003F51529C
MNRHLKSAILSEEDMDVEEPNEQEDTTPSMSRSRSLLSLFTFDVDLPHPSLVIVTRCENVNRNERLETMCLERRELDHAMSWLSTLGGAFSALGEKYEHFAYMAGRTSVEQFRLAIRLGDDLIVARCKLYYALSLIQRGYLSPARKIVKQQYDLAKNSVVVDNRLVRMCLGIWAKLKYEYAERRNKKNRLKIISS